MRCRRTRNWCRYCILKSCDCAAIIVVLLSQTFSGLARSLALICARSHARTHQHKPTHYTQRTTPIPTPTPAMKPSCLIFVVLALLFALNHAHMEDKHTAIVDESNGNTLSLATSVRADWYARCGSRYSSCTWAVKCREGSYSGCYADNKAITDACCGCYRACKKSNRRVYKERCRTRAKKYGRTC